jgi:hypothetical protein
LEFEREACGIEDVAVFVPDWRVMGQSIGVIIGHAHGINGFDGDGGEEYFEDLSDGEEPGCEVEADELSFWSDGRGGGVVSIGDEDFGAVTCAGEDFGDLGVDEF